MNTVVPKPVLVLRDTVVRGRVVVVVPNELLTVVNGLTVVRIVVPVPVVKVLRNVEVLSPVLVEVPVVMVDSLVEVVVRVVT